MATDAPESQHHEESETFQDQSGRWANYYGAGPGRGLRIPLEPGTSYATSKEADAAAQIRSDMFPESLDPSRFFDPSQPAATVPTFKDTAAGIVGKAPAQIVAEAPPPPSQDEIAAKRIAAQEAREAAIRRQSAFADAQDKEIERVRAESEAYAQKASQTLPQRPQIATPPSRGLRPFLATSENEPTENVVAKFMQAVTLMATMVGGGRSGARASLSALTGALQGWREGDRDRADRAFADWKSKTDALLEQSNQEIKFYELTMGAARVPIEQRIRLMELAARSNDNHMLADKFRVEDTAASLAEVERLRDAHLELQKWAVAMETQKSIADRQARDARERIEIARDRNVIENAKAVATAADRKERAAERQERIDDRKLEPAHGEFYDWKSGRIRQITKQEQMDNTLLQQRGETPEFTSLTNQQVSTLERLAIAPVIFNRAEELIKKITAAAPGENITKGMVNRVAMKAGLAPDLQEFRSLNVDAIMELTAALSGGQPRMTILQILRGEASPDMAMTTETALRALDTMRTTVRNRVTQITFDPDTLDKMSKRLQPYAPRPRIEGKIRVLDPQGRPAMVDAGTDLSQYPGWTYAP